MWPSPLRSKVLMAVAGRGQWIQVLAACSWERPQVQSDVSISIPIAAAKAPEDRLGQNMHVRAQT
jgi:hypothetical protein